MHLKSYHKKRVEFGKQDEHVVVELWQIRHGSSQEVQMLFFRNFWVLQFVTHVLPSR